MKITNIETFIVDAGARPWMFVKVETDEGVTGWGECSDVRQPHAIEGAIRDMTPLLIGQDPRAFEMRYQDLFRITRQSPGGISSKAIAGLDCALVDASKVRRLEDGPFGATPLFIGQDLVAEALSMPCVAGGEDWGAVRLTDYSLAETAHALSQSKLWLPGNTSPLFLKTISLGQLGDRGRVHRDINGPVPRGPFDKAPPSPTATYPSLWNHKKSGETETRMVCFPDSQLLVRPGFEKKAARIWATASRAHLNSEFTFGSQALAVAFTDTESIGGRVWPNVIFSDNRYDFVFAIWGNSTLGLLSHWWKSSRQQSSKVSITITVMPSLPVLDFRTLTDEQLRTAEAIFNDFRDKELKPAYLADADPNRALLDRRVVCDLLGFDEETYVGVRRLAAKWCAEPSVHGGKARPKGAALVV